MILVGTRDNAAARRRQVPIGNAIFYRSEWIDHGRDPQWAPNVILVEQPPNATLVAHFHQTNQFQMFVEGSGTLGPHVIEPYLVHYAGAFTGYGPLVAGPRGIKYFTLRAGWDSGFIPISERERMQRGPKRHAESAVFSSSVPGPASETRNGWGSRALIPMESDGLGATFTQLGADEPWRITGNPSSQGQFVVVLEGSLHYDETELGIWANLFVSADEAPLQLTAGARGATVVAMHMPPMEAQYGLGSSDAVAD